jgi:ATP-dependent helicase HrpA
MRMGSTHTELGKLIDDTLTRDHFQFRRRLRTIQRSAGSNHPNVSLEKLRADIAASVDQVANRVSRIPAVEYDTRLPVVERQDEIKTLIEKNQVIILCGETGSGKTTQLPKMLLEIGRGVRGQIAHTQPRRIAARTVAHRIAAELGTDLGDIVGYKVRFSDKSDPRNLIKLMTDGVLLAETQSDRFLDTYDTIVIDEAHERNLNVDF